MFDLGSSRLISHWDLFLLIDCDRIFIVEAMRSFAAVAVLALMKLM